MEKVVIVTGGSRGIGAATAKTLAKAGYKVCVNYRSRAAEAEQVVADILAAGGQAIAVPADVANEADVIRLFDTAEQQLGNISYLVNNVGILGPQSTLRDLSLERFNQVLAGNLTSCFLCCREAIRRMQSGGSIVNVSSAASRTGAPFEYVDYAAAKGGVDSLTRGLSLEVAAHGIRVNGVRPGFIYTDIHADGGEPDRIERLKPLIPLGRGGSAQEVANAIVWLLSDEASYVTGSILDIAGGK